MTYQEMINKVNNALVVIRATCKQMHDLTDTVHTLPDRMTILPFETMILDHFTDGWELLQNVFTAESKVDKDTSYRIDYAVVLASDTRPIDELVGYPSKRYKKFKLNQEKFADLKISSFENGT